MLLMVLFMKVWVELGRGLGFWGGGWGFGRKADFRGFWFEKVDSFFLRFGWLALF
jgi:hypothetical protein